jgi:hypothetical protein
MGLEVFVDLVSPLVIFSVQLAFFTAISYYKPLELLIRDRQLNAIMTDLVLTGRWIEVSPVPK